MLQGLSHSLSMSELSPSEQIRLALNTIGATDFGRVRGGGVALLGCRGRVHEGWPASSFMCGLCVSSDPASV
jgi:hypothetical protein